MTTILGRLFSSVPLLICFRALGQNIPTPVPMPNAILPEQRGLRTLDGHTIYRYVEKMPVYLDGGQNGLQTFVSHNVRGTAGGSGAYVTFIVDQAGKARNPALGPNSAESTAEVEPELAKAFRSIGPFRPGYQNGKPANVELTLKIAGTAKK